MAKKTSWDNLPQMVGKLLEIVSSEDSQQTAIPEIRQQIASLERKFDYLLSALSPDRPTMDRETVCRVLRLRPGQVHALAENGTLPHRTEGRRVLFYEDGVVKYFMTQPAWTSAIPKPEQPEAEQATDGWDDGQHVTVQEAGKIVGRSTAAIYQLTSDNRIPFHRGNGKSIYFIVGELREWVKTHPPRKRKA